MKLILTVIGILLIQNCIAQNNRITGGLLIPSIEKSNATIEPRIAPGAPPSLPNKIDLTNKTPLPGDQGTIQGSCSAWAAVYGLKSYQEAVEGKYTFDINHMDKSRLFSPSYIFNQIHDPNQPCQNGVFLIDVLEKLHLDGAVTLNDMDYDGNDCTSKPTQAALDLANKYAIDGYFTIYNFWKSGSVLDLGAIKAQLAKGYPVVLGVHLDNNFINDKLTSEFVDNKIIQVWRNFSSNNPQLTNTCNCYHAMLCVGYDEISTTFKLLNSWGDARSNQGYVYISYNAFKESVKEAYYAEDKPNNRQTLLVSNFIGMSDISLNKITEASKRDLGITDLAINKNAINKNKNNYFIDLNLKEGYFTTYKDLTICLVGYNSKDKLAIVKVFDDISKRDLGNIKVVPNKSFVFNYNNNTYAIAISNKHNQQENNPKLRLAFLKTEATFNKYINN